MKKFIGIIAIGLITMLMSFTLSDFYSSMTKVDYVEGSKTLKFTTKLNSGHIAEVLKINPNTTAFEAEVKRYVNDHFDVYVNGQNKVLTFTGSQVNGESVWVYFEANGVSDISSLKIKNNILLEAYPKQLNLVNIAYKGSQKNMTFMRGKEVNEISF
ncbi:DUF6702 family protein [Cloacibacterium sp. TD35]|uniref:DUF6702 family protein n=1 Tax=Cloacibacterium sp. TD35 TaxID=2976818 RepID=UPI00237E4250|nr:DUF6702 family protein [Cloacibacterium sp. TD35]WDT68763.1 M penetrans family 1 protein [Cloacibacterium sp. TD35]